MKAQVAAVYNGVALERPEFDLDKDTKKEWFKALSPMGKVPVLQTSEGTIFESNAIARYIARLRRDSNLYGKSFFESSQVDAWVDFALNEVELPASMWVYPVLGLSDFNPAVTAQSKKDLKAALISLEKHLKFRTFMVGDAVTLADIVLACALLYPFKMVLDAKFRKPLTNVTRWFITVVNQPQFRAVVGEVNLCETEILAAGAPAPGAKKGKKGKKGAAAGGAGGSGGKKAKKEKAAAPAAPAPKPKKKGPFEGLPKSSMDLDEWKRTYSNSRGHWYDSMPKFWDMLDREGYSVWFCAYNYNDDNRVDFQTSNLVGGFVQRCDSLRKYAFGMMQIFQGPPFEVEGAWLIRGQSIQPMLEENPDAEYYTWTKVDVEDEAQRKRVGDFWCAESDIGGKAIYDSKEFVRCAIHSAPLTRVPGLSQLLTLIFHLPLCRSKPVVWSSVAGLNAVACDCNLLWSPRRRIALPCIPPGQVHHAPHGTVRVRAIVIQGAPVPAATSTCRSVDIDGGPTVVKHEKAKDGVFP